MLLTLSRMIADTPAKYLKKKKNSFHTGTSLFLPYGRLFLSALSPASPALTTDGRVKKKKYLKKKKNHCHHDISK